MIYQVWMKMTSKLPRNVSPARFVSQWVQALENIESVLQGEEGGQGIGDKWSLNINALENKIQEMENDITIELNKTQEDVESEEIEEREESVQDEAGGIDRIPDPKLPTPDDVESISDDLSKGKIPEKCLKCKRFKKKIEAMPGSEGRGSSG